MAAKDFYWSALPGGLEYLANENNFAECLRTVDDATLRKWMGDNDEELWYMLDDDLRKHFPVDAVEEFIISRKGLSLALQHIGLVSTGVMNAIASLQVSLKKLSVQYPFGPARSPASASSQDSSVNYCGCLPEETSYSGRMCVKCGLPVF
jgi:hypothetical protein